MNLVITFLCLLGLSLAYADDARLENYPDRPIIEKPSSEPSDNLIILLHPIDTSVGFINFYYPLAGLRNKFSFNLVIPSGSKNKKGKRFFAAGAACCDHQKTGADDVKFLDEVIKHYRQKFSSKKVYLVGHSNGGFMANHYACYGKETINGFFSYAGNPSPSLKDCRSFSNLNVIHAHGRTDTFVPYYGGLLKKGGHYSIPTETYLANYQESLGCEPLEFVSKKNYTRNKLGRDFDILKSPSCARGNKLMFWDHFNGGHIPNFNRQYFKDVIQTLFKNYSM